MRVVNVLATWMNGKQETRAFEYRDNDNPLWIYEPKGFDTVPLATVRIWISEAEDGGKPEMSDAEFERRLRKWMRINPGEFEAWLRKRQRIHAGRPFAT